jgi:hypothetical protein
MTNDDQEHEDLKRLFEDTAQVASGPTLTKLGARAADIPERVAHKQRFLPRWAWGPAFAGAVMALGGLFALHAIAPKAAPQRAPVPGSAAPVGSVSVAVASASSQEVLAAAPKSTQTDDSSDNAELLGDSDEGAHFDVTGPQSDRDLDAWLAATKELSGGT